MEEGEGEGQSSPKLRARWNREQRGAGGMHLCLIEQGRQVVTSGRAKGRTGVASHTRMNIHQPHGKKGLMHVRSRNSSKKWASDFGHRKSLRHSHRARLQQGTYHQSSGTHDT